MSVIYAYIDPSNHPNEGKYTIHWVFEVAFFRKTYIDRPASLKEFPSPT